MANHHVVAVAAFVVAHHAHLAVEGRHYGVAGVDLDVQSLVYSLEGGTVAEAGGDVAGGGGHAEAAQVDAEAVGHFFGLVGMGAVGNPRGVYFAAHGSEVALYGTLDGHAVDGAEAAVDGSLTGDEVLRKCADGKSCAQKDEGRTPQDAEVHWLKG